MNINEPQILIFTLDRGWVVVGKAKLSTDLAFTWHLETSRVIRRWGTTKGLAELKDGPTSNTELDEVVEKLVPFRAIIAIDKPTDKGLKKWEKHL